MDHWDKGSTAYLKEFGREYIRESDPVLHCHKKVRACPIYIAIVCITYLEDF